MSEEKNSKGVPSPSSSDGSPSGSSSPASSSGATGRRRSIYAPYRWGVPEPAALQSVRHHPLLPTPQEIQENPELVYSNHLPILVSVPWVVRELKIISLSNLPITDENWKSAVVVQKRYARIAAGLKLAVAAQGAEIICLQEVSFPRSMADLLKAQLGEEWKVLVNKRSHMVTCYRKHLKLQNEEKEIAGVHTLKLTDIDGKGIIVHNVLGRPGHFNEEDTRALLSVGHCPEFPIKVAVGNFNSSIAEVPQRKGGQTSNIITSVGEVHTVYDEAGAPLKIQRTAFTDGGFCSDEDEIRQLPVRVLDFQNGQEVQDFRPLEELELVPEYQKMMCLDKAYETLRVDENKTIAEYNAYLARYGEPGGVLGVVGNELNRKGLQIQLPKNSPAGREMLRQLRIHITKYPDRKRLKELENLRIQVRWSEEDNDTQTYSLSVPLAESRWLLNFVHSAIARTNRDLLHNQLIRHISPYLTALYNKPKWLFFNTPSVGKIKFLNDLIEEIGRVPFDASHQALSDVIQRHRNEAVIDEKYFSFTPGITNTRRLFNELEVMLQRFQSTTQQKASNSSEHSSLAPSSSS